MKKNKGLFRLFILILLVSTLVLSACGTKGNTSSAPSQKKAVSNESAEYSMDQAASPEVGRGISLTGTSGNAGQSLEFEKMMIYTGRLEIEANNIKETSDFLLDVVKKANGYITNSTQSENDYRFTAHYEFSIPVNGFEPLVQQIADISFGKVTYQNVNGQDVTEEYLDLTSRLKAKEVYEERLLDFLTNATKTEDLLKISNDLNRVQEEIEQLKGRQKYLSHYAAYSTLTVDIEQYKNRVAPASSSWEKAKDGFSRSLSLIEDFLKGTFVLFVSYIPIIVLIIIMGIIAWRLARKGIKRKNPYNDSDNDLT